MKNEKKEWILKVEEAKARDVGRGIARIDPEVAEEIGLVPGDVVLIEGKRKQLLYTGRVILKILERKL